MYSGYKNEILINMKNQKLLFFAIATLVLISFGTPALAQEVKNELKTYLIEREIPGAGDMSAEELKAISQTSCAVLKDMGPQIEWLHSYVTDNKIYCVYKAENMDLIREHGEKGGFPVNSISELSTTISPATAELKP